MEISYPFICLEHAESTNTHAMQQVKCGLAVQGMAWFTDRQTAGKGQRGKIWESEPGLNIALSVAIQPPKHFQVQQFHFNACVALACLDFLQSIHGQGFSLKWPNDLYWNNEKLGGILIENQVQGQQWKWAVAGIGLNVNQTSFSPDIRNPVSLKQITGKDWSPRDLARRIQEIIVSRILSDADPGRILLDYNDRLYKRGEPVVFQTGTRIFTSRIESVNAWGQLILTDPLEKAYSVGEILFL